MLAEVCTIDAMIGVDMLADVEIIVVTPSVIDFMLVV